MLAYLLLSTVRLGPTSSSPAPSFGDFDGGNVGSGVLIAHGPTLRIGGGLGEHTTQLNFARVRRSRGQCAICPVVFETRSLLALGLSGRIKNRELATNPFC